MSRHILAWPYGRCNSRGPDRSQNALPRVPVLAEVEEWLRRLRLADPRGPLDEANSRLLEIGAAAVVFVGALPEIVASQAVGRVPQSAGQSCDQLILGIGRHARIPLFQFFAVGSIS